MLERYQLCAHLPQLTRWSFCHTPGLPILPAYRVRNHHRNGVARARNAHEKWNISTKSDSAYSTPSTFPCKCCGHQTIWVIISWNTSLFPEKRSLRKAWPVTELQDSLSLRVPNRDQALQCSTVQEKRGTGIVTLLHTSYPLTLVMVGFVNTLNFLPGKCSSNFCEF